MSMSCTLSQLVRVILPLLPVWVWECIICTAIVCWQDTSGVSFLSKIPAKTPGGKDIDYKKSKISLTYVDVPLELRFKTASGFRVSAGFKVGYLINAHTKYKGDDLDDGSKTKIKVSRLPNLQTWRFGPSFQIGYKWVNLMGFYSISTIFQENQGPAIYPVSLGLSLRPF